MMKYTCLALLLAVLLNSCSETPSYKLKNGHQREFIVTQDIVQVMAYESGCNGEKEHLSFKTVYNSEGDEAEYESYFGGEVMTKSSQEYENGLLMKRTYYPNKTMPKTIVKYEYNDKGERTKYALFDEQENRISLHKIERKGKAENISDYDAKGKLVNYRTVMYDSLDNPLVFETRKLRYSYNEKGLMTESASVDTLSGAFIRKVYEYREYLPVKQTVYYGDSCVSVIRYEYKKSSGEKW